MFRKILVPLDSSPIAERALPVAVQLAQKMQAELILLSVAWKRLNPLVEPMGYIWVADESEVSGKDQLDQYLDYILEKLAPTKIPMRRLLLEGDEAGEIVDTAVQQKADLIIMTTHGRSGVSRWLMGSVTERVLRQTPCPILVVRDEPIPDNIIITLDGSELAEEALLPGLALAIATQAEVTLLQVDEGIFLPLQTQEMLEKKHSFATLYLQTVAERFSHHKVHKTVLTGNPAEAILNFADLLPNSLIVMSTHGRSGLARWVFGSVTEKVVRGAKSSVLVVSPLKIA